MKIKKKQKKKILSRIQMIIFDIDKDNEQEIVELEDSFLSYITMEKKEYQKLQKLDEGYQPFSLFFNGILSSAYFLFIMTTSGISPANAKSFSKGTTNPI